MREEEEGEEEGEGGGRGEASSRRRSVGEEEKPSEPAQGCLLPAAQTLVAARDASVTGERRSSPALNNRPALERLQWSRQRKLQKL